MCLEEDVVEDEDDFVRSGFCEDRLDGLGEQAAIVLLSAVTITKVTEVLSQKYVISHHSTLAGKTSHN